MLFAKCKFINIYLYNASKNINKKNFILFYRGRVKKIKKSLFIICL